MAGYPRGGRPRLKTLLRVNHSAYGYGKFAGSVGELMEDDGSDTPFKVMFPSGDHGWFRLDEVEECKILPGFNVKVDLEIGESVRVLSSSSGNRRQVANVGSITEKDANALKVTFADETFGWFRQDELQRVSEQHSLVHRISLHTQDPSVHEVDNVHGADCHNCSQSQGSTHATASLLDWRSRGAAEARRSLDQRRSLLQVALDLMCSPLLVSGSYTERDELEEVFAEGMRIREQHQHDLDSRIRAEARFRDGTVYRGGWRNGQRNGSGELESPSQHRFQGQWKNDMMHGSGKYTFPDGTLYDGAYWKGKFHGSGMLIYSGGSQYKGQFVEGKRHGDGIFVGPNNDVYDGHWVSDVPEGEGQCSFTTGDVYRGQWVEGRMHGRGTYTYANGEQIQGIWINGRKERQLA